jgi:recombination DNA repair RAD52 pathway protein
MAASKKVRNNPKSASYSDNSSSRFTREGPQRAQLTFELLLSLVADAEGSRNLSREESLGKDLRVRGFKRNFRALTSAVNRIGDNELRGEILHYVGQMLETTYTLGFYGPKNYLDEAAAKEAERKKTHNAREAAKEISARRFGPLKNIVLDRLREYREENPSTVETPHAIQVQIRPKIEKDCKTRNLDPPSERTIENYISAKLFLTS